MQQTNRKAMQQKRPVNRIQSFHIAQRGFTLIEFMVAAILGLMVLLAIGGAYVATQRVNNAAQARVQRQQELRLAGNMLMRDARMAGTFGCANISAFATSGGYVVDNESTVMTTDTPSYFSLDDTSPVFGTRIVASSFMSNIVSDTAFIPSSEAVLFNYGMETQPLLTSTVNGNELDTLTLPTGKAAQFDDGARAVLASCKRVDILQKNQMSVSGDTITLANGATSIPFKTIGDSDEDNAQYASQATLSRLHTVAYAVGNVADDTGAAGLYRFELLADGSWSPPQLLVRNIDSMNLSYQYVNKCETKNSVTQPTEYKVSSNAFIEPTGTTTLGKIAPSAVQIVLTPAVTRDALNNEDVTSATDNLPIVLNATMMRGVNLCAN